MLWYLAVLLIVHEVQACPEGCTCDIPDGYIDYRNQTISLVKTFCQHAPQLMSIPQTLSKNLGVLIFKSNGLRGLTNESLSKYHYLKELDFSNNKIEEITSGAFAKQLHLIRLILQDNHLKKLSKEVLNGLFSLQELYLQNNDIYTLDRGVFNNLKSLRKLHLHDNDLMSLEPGTFHGLDSLKELDISGCYIKNIGPGLIANLMSLEIINLSYNNIQVIDDNAFRCSPLVKELHVNNNSLVEIPDLHLLRYLEDLDVSENPITHIHSHNFESNINLKSLNVSFCKMTFLQQEALSFSKRLDTISLEGNPLHCDCHVLWIQQQMEIFSRPELTVCQTPLELSGRPIHEANDMKCNCNECKKHFACKNRYKVECKCFEGNKHQNCDNICTILKTRQLIKQNVCDYVNGKCLCTNKTTINEPFECHFEITNQTCSEDAHLTKVGKNLQCACNKGFYGDGINCTDIDECNRHISYCFDDTVCYNTIGSYRCDCQQGFAKLASSPRCVDVDECKNTNICGIGAVCINGIGKN